MRAIFGFVGLLVVLAIVMINAKHSTQTLKVASPAGASSAGAPAEPRAQTEAVREQVQALVEPLGRKVEAVIDYDGCTIDPTLAEAWFDMARDVQSRFYDKASRYTTSAFMRLKLGDALQRRRLQLGMLLMVVADHPHPPPRRPRANLILFVVGFGSSHTHS